MIEHSSVDSRTQRRARGLTVLGPVLGGKALQRPCSGREATPEVISATGWSAKRKCDREDTEPGDLARLNPDVPAEDQQVPLLA